MGVRSEREEPFRLDQEVIFIVIVFENFKIELDVSEFSSMQSLMIWRFLTRVRNVKNHTGLRLTEVMLIVIGF